MKMLFLVCVYILFFLLISSCRSTWVSYSGYIYIFLQPIWRFWVFLGGGLSLVSLLLNSCCVHIDWRDCVQTGHSLQKPCIAQNLIWQRMDFPPPLCIEPFCTSAFIFLIDKLMKCRFYFTHCSRLTVPWLAIDIVSFVFSLGLKMAFYSRFLQ